MSVFKQFVGHRLYLDTNVFIYFVEAHPAFSDVLCELFAAIEDEEVSVVTSELTLAEAMVKPLSCGQPENASVYVDMLSPGSKINISPVDRRTLQRSAEVRARTGVRAFDAIHVATAMLENCHFLLSEDSRLAVPSPMRHVRLSELSTAP